MTASDGALHRAITDGHVIICGGSGGVGKTTTSAALALAAAHAGRRAVVVTIDPAKRLADALGLSELSSEPQRIEGPWPGELWAFMLDTKNTFDALVTRYSKDPVQAERILANPFYRNVSGTLSGTQEYMAAEKLFELYENQNFDLIVVDTPPTRNALDFLDAPERLSRFLNHRLYRVLTAPTRGLIRAVNVAAQTLLRSVTKVVGGEVIGDAIAFFQAFDGMESGFKDRALAVKALLVSDVSRYVVVTAPTVDSIAEASFFTSRLEDDGVSVDAIIVNRVTPTFGGDIPPTDEAIEADLDLARRASGTAIGAAAAARAQLRRLAQAEQREIAALIASRKDGSGPEVCLVPVFARDVHDLDGLNAIRAQLFPSE